MEIVRRNQKITFYRFHGNFLRTWLLSTRRNKKGSNQRGNFIRCRVQRKMAGVEDMDLRLLHILAVAFRFAGIEREDHTGPR